MNIPVVYFSVFRLFFGTLSQWVVFTSLISVTINILSMLSCTEPTESKESQVPLLHM